MPAHANCRCAVPALESIPPPAEEIIFAGLCDADGIAIVQVELVKDCHSLSLCAHHFMQHGEVLSDAGWEVVFDSRLDLLL
jgi:hypothetical protein